MWFHVHPYLGKIPILTNIYVFGVLSTFEISSFDVFHLNESVSFFCLVLMH